MCMSYHGLSPLREIVLCISNKKECLPAHVVKVCLPKWANRPDSIELVLEQTYRCESVGNHDSLVLFLISKRFARVANGGCLVSVDRTVFRADVDRQGRLSRSRFPGDPTSFTPSHSINSDQRRTALSESSKLH